MANGQLGCLLFHSILDYILTITNHHSESLAQEIFYNGLPRSKEEHLVRLGAYYKFLKCSYWLPADQNHYITPSLVSLLVRSVGQEKIDEYAHDVLSSLLSLLTSPNVVVLKVDALPEAWGKLHTASNNYAIVPGVLSDAFFDRLRDLPIGYFTGNASKAFRTWFQWVSYMASSNLQTEAVQSGEYWLALRTGVVNGSTDQRKYCLGIIQQSLLLCKTSFETSSMKFDVDKRETTMKQYQKYCTLFETIVLDRYPNQVQACLSELTALLGPTSDISPAWVTAMLTAALNPKVQDGVRKPIGNWYLNYAITQPESCISHTTFLVEGLLPWATQGSLFSSTLAVTRTSTTCSHGETLMEAMAQLVSAVPVDGVDSNPRASLQNNINQAGTVSNKLSQTTEKRKLTGAVLGYILNTGGNIFAPAIPYLLEGLLKGINHERTISLEAFEIDVVARISGLPAMQEITAELCRTYHVEFCKYRDSFLDKSTRTVQDEPTPDHPLLDFSQAQSTGVNALAGLETLGNFLKELDRTQHKIIQNDAFVPACAHITNKIENCVTDSILPNELLQVLDAFWEEADRQDYPRPVAIRLAPLFFHPTCVRTIIRQQSDASTNELTALLTKALTSLHRSAEGRSYLISGLTASLRRAVFLNPELANILPLDDFFVRFVQNPPTLKKEFLFEIVAAEKLKELLSDKDESKAVFGQRYEAYYGEREWVGYATAIDLLNCIPKDQVPVAKRVMDRLLEPWGTQRAPIPIISKWKNVLQLQIMLLLTEVCVIEDDAEHYLDSFMHALILEPWPRYRYLLEWAIARIYFHFPNKAHHILDNLAKLDDNVPVHIASLMKLALLVAPFLDSEEFALRLVVQLIPLSASPKVQIRHEAHWCFPTVFDLAKDRNWRSITENPAFVALDRQIRNLDKFNAPASTIRTLKMDAVKDFTLTSIFQGQYLTIETPDMEYVANEDFLALKSSDSTTLSHSHASPPRVPLGDPLPAPASAAPPTEQKKPPAVLDAVIESAPAFFQTKSGFDVASLLPSAGRPSAQQKRPASVILIASLIDNPTNLGGLSRIAESFGLEALYIGDLKKTAHKDFKATSVTSEKHFPIRQLKTSEIPSFIIDMKRKGYEVVGIEQTDRSGMLGEGENGSKDVGTLPKKCVLVLGAEKSGITSEVLAVVDRCVEIKTVGVTRSLNVQTAGGIAVYEWWREWGAKL